jgi:asparagine synthetase B (glutamine-hydrolysing)
LGDELLVSPFQDVLIRQARVPKTLNTLALAEWVLDLVSDVDATFFERIRRLPPATQLRFDRELRLERYWHPEDDPPVIPSEETEVHAAFDQLLIQAVDRCLRPARPGIFLSGGVDSGLVAAVAAERTRARQAPAPLALSAAFPDPQSNEVATQKAVATALGIELVLLPVEDRGADGVLLPLLLTAAESHLPTTAPWEAVYERLAAVARERGCRSLLTGDGGNELLEARWQLAADLLRRGDLRKLRTLYRLGRSYYGFSRRGMLRTLAWRSGARIVVRDWVGAMVGSARPDIVGAWYRSRYSNVIPKGLVPDEALRTRVVDRMLDVHPAPSRGAGYPALRRRVYDDPATALAIEASFAWGQKVGMETHAPLLDVDLIRFLYHIPPELLSFGGRAKGLAQASLDRRLDTHRLPVFRAASPETFFRTVLEAEAGRAVAMLGGAPILSGLGIIDKSALDAAVQGDFSPGNLGYSGVWSILGLEAWLRSRV